MFSVLERLIAVFLSIVLLLFQAGCADLPYRLPPPLSEEARARLGTIGIVSANFAPETKLFTYARGRVRGAAEGMAFERRGGPAFGVPGGLSGGPGAGGAALLLLGILAGAAAIYGVYRMATAIPAEQVKEIESDLKKALIELRMQESLKERFFQTARQQSAFNFVLVREGGPKTIDEIVNYGHLKEKGVDTVIELSILSVGFEGGGTNQTLSFRSL